MAGPDLLSAKIQSLSTVELVFAGSCPPLRPGDIVIDNGIVVHDAITEDRLVRLQTSPFDPTQHYRVTVWQESGKDLIPDGVLDGYVSRKPLGCCFEEGRTVFRVFAPRATEVRLVLFAGHDDSTGPEWPMRRDADGVWEAAPDGSRDAAYYGYRIRGCEHPTEMFNPGAVIGDPYARAVCTGNHFLHPAKCLIRPPSDFDWGKDAWICPPLEDLVVYEMHVRDMTAHPDSGVPAERRGTYLGLVEPGARGGLEYIKSLGVNAVELLPVQEFANCEPDFRNPESPVYNDWNPYARNHWGYMPTYFFAPESYYATGSRLDPGGTTGADGRQVSEFKRMIQSFHRAGLAVILDVVYNHVSQYDLNPFKYIDKKYYFRLDHNQDFEKTSGCGNDFRTERPMVRRLIVDSVLHWMREYHVDGFRFDLAAMVDGETLDAVTRAARALNPDVILIAEPWGGGKYGYTGFSERGWGAWNDRFRDGVKGNDPRGGRGWIFGCAPGDGSDVRLRQYASGSISETGGPFLRIGHAVNYLESHDGCTLGDFIRLALGTVREDQAVDGADALVPGTVHETAAHKLGALFLLTSRGAVMIHEGQEFARSRVIEKTGAPDPCIGRIDCNGYNKDNETNWIRYSHADANRPLVEYYRGLIALRNRYPGLRKAGPDRVRFLGHGSPTGFGYLLDPGQDTQAMAVLMNSNPSASASFELPSGVWGVLADRSRAGTEAFRFVPGGILKLPPVSGMVLLRQNTD
jgi:pullulanase/glycogen debranching enzyme